MSQPMVPSRKSPMASTAWAAFLMGNIWNTCHMSATPPGGRGRRSGPACPETVRVGEQDLVGAHLDEDRGEAAQVPEEGGEGGDIPLTAGGVGGPDGLDVVHGSMGSSSRRSW